MDELRGPDGVWRTPTRDEWSAAAGRLAAAADGLGRSREGRASLAMMMSRRAEQNAVDPVAEYVRETAPGCGADLRAGVAPESAWAAMQTCEQVIADQPGPIIVVTGQWADEWADTVLASFAPWAADVRYQGAAAVRFEIQRSAVVLMTAHQALGAASLERHAALLVINPATAVPGAACVVTVAEPDVAAAWPAVIAAAKRIGQVERPDAATATVAPVDDTEERIVHHLGHTDDLMYESAYALAKAAGVTDTPKRNVDRAMQRVCARAVRRAGWSYNTQRSPFSRTRIYAASPDWTAARMRAAAAAAAAATEGGAEAAAPPRGVTLLTPALRRRAERRRRNAPSE